jgi:hypothetical protein
MKLEVSLTCSQEFATGPYLKPEESSPHTTPLSYFFQIYFNIIINIFFEKTIEIFGSSRHLHTAILKMEAARQHHTHMVKNSREESATTSNSCERLQSVYKVVSYTRIVWIVVTIFRKKKELT